MPRGGTRAGGRKARMVRDKNLAAETGMTFFERRALMIRRRTMQARSKRMGVGTVADLRAIVASSGVPVTKLPPGTHAGWMPRWMR